MSINRDLQFPQMAPTTIITGQSASAPPGSSVQGGSVASVPGASLAAPSVIQGPPPFTTGPTVRPMPVAPFAPAPVVGTMSFPTTIGMPQQAGVPIPMPMPAGVPGGVIAG